LIQADEQMDTPVNLVLAGGASHAEAYGKRLRRHQSDRVRILDWVSGEALDERLTNAMLFVLPSDIPENRELVDGTAFTFRHGDRDDLERMLRLLISEPWGQESCCR